VLFVNVLTEHGWILLFSGAANISISGFSMTTDIPVSQPYEWTFRRVVWATLVFAFVVFCFWLVYRFYEVVFTLFIAIVFGTVIRPIVEWLYQRGSPRMVGVILVYFAILLLVAGFLWLIFPLIFEQGKAIVNEIPGFYKGLRSWMVHTSNPLLSRIGISLPAGLPFMTPVPLTDAEVVDSAPQAWFYLTTIASVFFAVIVIPMLTLYWTLDGPRIIKSLVLLLPQDRRESMTELIATMEAKIGLYLVGQAILSLVIGLLALITYAMIGLPNALVLALIAGVMEAIPLIGPFLGAVPAALVALSIGPDRLIWVLIASLVIQQLEGAILVPRVMKRTVGVNPFVTLLSLFAFGTLFGVAGALMAIPLAAIIQLILDHFVFKQTTVKLEASERRDYVSRIRYEAQDLIQDLRKQARERKHGSEQKIVQTEFVMDEIETLAANLDELLAQTNAEGE
jgi:predicted PurR-regulated permease PerM